MICTNSCHASLIQDIYSKTGRFRSQPCLFLPLTLCRMRPFTFSPLCKTASRPVKSPHCKFPPHCAGMSEGISGMQLGMQRAAAAVGVVSGCMRSFSLLTQSLMHSSATVCIECMYLRVCECVCVCEEFNVLREEELGTQWGSPPVIPVNLFYWNMAHSLPNICLSNYISSSI